MHRFLVEGPLKVGVPCALAPDEAHHALRVLRLAVGDAVCLSDGEGLWSAVIDRADGEGVCARVLSALCDGESPARITVYQGILKGDKLELLAQKLTELGADALCPVRMARCVARWDEREGEKKRARLERIALEAVKQCGRARPMRVLAPISFGEAAAHAPAHALFLMPWEEARGLRMRDVHALTGAARDIGILIGPEGGIAQDEADRMCAAGARAVTLGPRILRAETAPIACCAMAQQLWGDM